MVDPDVGGTDAFRHWMRQDLDGDDGELLDELLATAEELYPQARAANTRAAYRKRLTQFYGFCAEFGKAALPTSPQTVAAFVLYLTSRGRMDRRGGREGGEPYSHTALRGYLTAIRHDHLQHDHPDPTDHTRVRTLLTAYGRRYGRPERRAHGYTLDELELMAMRLTMPTGAQLRDAALCLLATDPAADVNACQLARLRWDELTLPTHESEPAVISPRTGQPTHFAGGADDAGATAAALRHWAAHATDAVWVFPSPHKSAQPMTRQAACQRVDTWLARLRLGGDPGSAGLPTLATAQRRRLAERLAEPSDQQRRDLALLTLMWWGQLRRSEAATLQVGDVSVRDDRLVLRLVHGTKGDPRKHGETVTIYPTNDLVCAQAAVTAWLARYTDLASGDLADTAPLVPNLHRGGPGTGVSGEAVNRVCKGWADMAGIEPLAGERLSSQGMRAGSAGEMLAAGEPTAVVADHGRRADPSSLQRYYRPTDTYHGNPTRRLGDRRRASQPAPTHNDPATATDGEPDGDTDTAASREFPP